MSLNENTASYPPFPLDLQADRTKGESAQTKRIASEQEFNELYRDYGALVHGVLLARLPRDEVQDVVQEVFLAAFKSLHSVREKDALGGWLVKIARNQAANYYRSSRPTEELTDYVSPGRASSSEAAEILDAIKAMPEAYRETLILRLVEGMSGDEIARQTGMTKESVRVNLHRGMKKLRERLGIKV